MLDSHPRLAIPGPSHFIVRLSYRRLRLMHRPDLALERVLAHPRFIAWGLDAEQVREFVAQRRPETFPDVVSAVFGAYAAERGKARGGDKTPGYVHFIPVLRRLFPGAKVIHVIRDGRESAASIAEQVWWPGGPISAAFWWRGYVRAGRRDGARLGADYHEVRLHALIADPQAELKKVCALLQEDYDPAMLEYPATARGRLGRGPDEPMPPDLRHLEEPPTPGLRDWRAGLSPATVAAVEAACYPVLRDLGFEVSRPRLAIRLYARMRWLGDMPPRVRLFIQQQLRPKAADI
jgi:hypothetical protein